MIDRATPRLAVVVVAALLGVATVGGCGDDDDAAAGGPLVGEVAVAIEALEHELGDGAAYFEINADRLKVTMWVATDDATVAVPYVWAAGELSAPQDGQEADGLTFAGEQGLTFDADRILDDVTADFGERVESFSIVGSSGTGVRFSVVVRSERGGRLEVALSRRGDILEAGVID